jgi:hypothetical protein
MSTEKKDESTLVTLPGLGKHGLEERWCDNGQQLYRINYANGKKQTTLFDGKKHHCQ